MHLAHVALAVANIEQTLEFYREGLGLEKSWEFTGETGIQNHYFRDDAGNELQFTYHPEQTPEHNGHCSDYLREHVAIGVADVNRTFDQLIQANNPPILEEPFVESGSEARVAFVRDPDNYALQLLEVDE